MTLTYKEQQRLDDMISIIDTYYTLVDDKAEMKMNTTLNFYKEIKEKREKNIELIKSKTPLSSKTFFYPKEIGYL